MTFIFKLAFWGFIILMLLPSSQKDKLELYSAAEKTAGDVFGFCDRNPDVCEKAKATFFNVVQKVRLGAEMLEDTMSDQPAKPASDEGGQRRIERSKETGGDDVAANAVVENSQNTLKQDDLAPDWRGPVRDGR